MDVAVAAAAVTASMTVRAGARKSEPWAAVAEKAARSAGVGALHGKALDSEEAGAGGRPGVTWSDHPHFRKYFMLLRLGMPREQVVAKAVRSGVPPSILDRGDEEVPLSTEYSVVSPCAPLLRVTPDLDSTPVAQLNTSSGIIYTADPSKAFGSYPAAAAASSDTAGSNGKPSPRPGLASVASGAVAATAVSFEGAEGTGPSRAITDTVAADDSCASSAGKGAAAEKVADEEESSRHPSVHPLVLSGRRVWVVSPVVGWASVWAENRQSILTPAGIEDGSDGGNSNGVDKSGAAVEGGHTVKSSPSVCTAYATPNGAAAVASAPPSTVHDDAQGAAAAVAEEATLVLPGPASPEMSSASFACSTDSSSPPPLGISSAGKGGSGFASAGDVGVGVAGGAGGVESGGGGGGGGQQQGTPPLVPGVGYGEIDPEEEAKKTE